MASATRVNLSDAKQAKKDLGQRQGWQEDAWAYFDAVPEVKQGVWFMGNGMAKVRLFVATLPPGADEPVPVTAEGSGISADIAARAEAELARLQGALGGQSEIVRELTMNIDVAGEAFLVGWGPRDAVVDPLTGEMKQAGSPETWDVRSVSEVEAKETETSAAVVKDSPGDKGRPVERGRDTIIRVWQRHPRWSALADSAMAGVLGDCEALVTLHHQSMAESRSRHNAGILTVPNELSFGGAHPEQDEDGDDDTDPLSEELHESFTDPVDNSGSPSAVSPTIIRGPGEFLKPEYLRWIDLGRKSTAELDAKITTRVERLARGLNMPVEYTMGHQSTTFANAEQVNQDLFDDYYEPRAVLVCDGLTVGFLRPQLLDVAEGAPPPPATTVEQVQRMFVWYDSSHLVRPPDLSDAAGEALDKGAIDLEAYRRHKGFPETDAPEETAGTGELSELSLEQVQTIARMAQQLYLAVPSILTSEEVRMLLNAVGLPVVGPVPPEPAAPAEEQAAVTASVLARMLAPGMPAERMDRLTAVLASSPTLAGRVLEARASETPTAPAPAPLVAETIDAGRRLLDVDRELRARLLVLADAAMARALERAGNRLRSRVEFRSTLKHVPPHLAGVTLGRALVADAISEDELLDAAFAPMREQFMSWGAGAQADALEIVNGVVGGFTASERAALGLRQATDLDEAWTWLESTLRALAKGRLFDPSFGMDDVGEIAEGLSVPPGLIREAMARAGGAAGIETTGDGSAWVTLSEGSTRPAGGIALGDLLRAEMAARGATVEGYRWVYGPAQRRRPFEPHARLSGRTFVNFDDDVLTNSNGWPPFSHYMPGDHAGCLCDAEPVIISPDGSAVADY